MAAHSVTNTPSANPTRGCASCEVNTWSEVLQLAAYAGIPSRCIPPGAVCKVILMSLHQLKVAQNKPSTSLPACSQGRSLPGHTPPTFLAAAILPLTKPFITAAQASAILAVLITRQHGQHSRCLIQSVTGLQTPSPQHRTAQKSEDAISSQCGNCGRSPRAHMRPRRHPPLTCDMG